MRFLSVFWARSASGMASALGTRRYAATPPADGRVAQLWVDMDFEGIAEDAVRRFVDLGHRRIAMARPASEINYGYISAEAFSEAIAKRAGGCEGRLMRAESNEAGGYELGEALLKTSPRPTALVLVNVDMAIGLYRRLSEAGFRPGADLAIIGFHYGAHCKFLAPALTCYQTELTGLGACLGEALLACMTDFAHLFPTGVVQAVWPMRRISGESDNRSVLQTASGASR